MEMLEILERYAKKQFKSIAAGNRQCYFRFVIEKGSLFLLRQCSHVMFNIGLTM